MLNPKNWLKRLRGTRESSDRQSTTAAPASARAPRTIAKHLASLYQDVFLYPDRYIGWLYHLAGRPASVYAEQRAGKVYYQLNLPSAVRVGAKGEHLRKDPAEIRRIRPSASDSEWVFDLATESGVFCAGVGRVVPRHRVNRG